MYNVLLVDDDAFFASVFLSNFDWEQNGFTISAHAESGARAVELLHARPVDLAFIDMCMPGMNGPTLIAYITANFPDILCVALSNHDDFDFVKESFRAGAIDYVLKHCLNRRELRGILDAFLDRRGLQRVASPQGEPDDALSTEGYLTSLLEGRIILNAGDYSITDTLKLPRLEKNLLVIRTQIDHFEQFKQKFSLLSKLPYILRSVAAILRNLLERHTEGVVFFNANDNGFYSILTDERLGSVQFLSHTQDLYMKQVRSSLKMYFNVDCESVAAPLIGDVRDLRYAYREIRRLISGCDSLSDQPDRRVDFESIYAHALSSLAFSLSSPDSDDARRYIASRYEDGRRFDYGDNQFLQLTVTLYKVWLACSQKLEGCDASQPSDFTAIFDMKDVRDMEKYVVTLFEDLHRRCRQETGGQYSRHVVCAIDIISRQYDMCSLSLNVIADMIHVSAPYLSRSFKQEMGIGISEYINRYRVERAQTLFTIERVSVKSAALRCGFDNYTYFFRIFKKYTSLTPKEFCEKHNLYLPDSADEGEQDDD